MGLKVASWLLTSSIGNWHLGQTITFRSFTSTDRTKHFLLINFSRSLATKGAAVLAGKNFLQSNPRNKMRRCPSSRQKCHTFFVWDNFIKSPAQMCISAKLPPSDHDCFKNFPIPQLLLSTSEIRPNVSNSQTIRATVSLTNFVSHKGNRRCLFSRCEITHLQHGVIL